MIVPTMPPTLATLPDYVYADVLWCNRIALSDEDMPVTVLRSDVLEAEDVVSEAIFVAVAAVPSTCLSTSQWNGSKARSNRQACSGLSW